MYWSIFRTMFGIKLHSTLLDQKRAAEVMTSCCFSVRLFGLFTASVVFVCLVQALGYRKAFLPMEISSAVSSSVGMLLSHAF